MKSLHSTLHRFKAERCIIVFDGGISDRRRELYPRYKKSYRSAGDPFYSPPDDDKVTYVTNFDAQIRYLRFALKRMKVSVVQLRGWEADDVIYRIAHIHADPGITYVISDDQDYFQMVKKWNEDGKVFNVILHRAMKDITISAATFDDVVGHPQSQHLLRRTIIGDSSDKIEGINGVGPVTLDKIFSTYTGPVEYPFEDFILYCADQKSETIQKISDDFGAIIRNYELMAFDYEEYTDDAQKSVIKQLQPFGEPDLHKAKQFFAELDIFSISNNFHQWVVPFQRLK